MTLDEFPYLTVGMAARLAHRSHQTVYDWCTAHPDLVAVCFPGKFGGFLIYRDRFMEFYPTKHLDWRTRPRKKRRPQPPAHDAAGEVGNAAD